MGSTVSTINAGTRGQYFTASVIDVKNKFVYFGTNSAPAAVVKISTTTNTVSSVLQMKRGEANINGASAIDERSEFVFFAMQPAGKPSVVVSIQLSNFQKSAALQLSPGEYGAQVITRLMF